MHEPEFAKLYSDMEQCHVKPLWLAERSVNPAQPQPKTVPWLWKWSQLSNLVQRSCELVTLDRGGDRRAMGLANPGLGGAPYATNTYHEHLNESKSERAILFSAQDTPVLVALGKYREEALTANNGFQTVKEAFAVEKALTYG